MTASTELTALCARTLDNLKAENIIALDLRNVDSSPADYFVICSANSETHARALTDALARVTVSVGERRPRTEGRDTGEWVLLDYFDVVVHIFRTTAREYYKLEKLWGDAPALDLKQLIEKPKAAKPKAEAAKTPSTKASSAKTAAAKKTTSSKVTTPKATKEKSVKEKIVKEKVAKEGGVEKTTAKKATPKAPTKVASKVASATTTAKKTVKTSTKANAETSDKSSVEAPKTQRSMQKASGGEETKVAAAAKPKAAPKAKASVKKVSAK